MEENNFNYQLAVLEGAINNLQRIAMAERETIDTTCRDSEGRLDLRKYVHASTVLELVKSLTATKNAIDYMHETLFDKQ